MPCIIILKQRAHHSMQGEASCRTRLPITINILCTLKMQLRSSASFSPVEKHLFWAAFTLAFYGFLRASELTFSSQMEFSSPGLHWCDITSQPSILTITLRQSKTDPFHHGHSISISPKYQLFYLSCESLSQVHELCFTTIQTWPSV